MIGVDEVETDRLMTDADLPGCRRPDLDSLPSGEPRVPPVSWKRIACTMFGLNFWLNGRADRLAGTTALGKLQTSVRDGMRTPARAGRRIIQSAYGNRRLQQPDPSHHSQPPGSGLGCPVAAVRGRRLHHRTGKIDDFVVALATAESERFMLFGIPLEPAEDLGFGQAAAKSGTRVCIGELRRH